MALFSARQPIFNKNKEVFAYELLYRQSQDQKEAFIVDGSQATARVLTHALMVSDYDKLVNNKKIFINFTKELILREVAMIFDPSKLVIEILEDIDGDEEIIEKVQDLKEAGYTIALDDMAFNTNQDSLLEYVDIVKVDFMLLDKEGRNEITRKLKKYNLKLLAEKVETMEDFKQALDLGYDYFQGFFFSKPEIMKNNDVETLKSTQISLMHELNKEDINVDRVVTIIQSDVSMTLKLLKLLSSAAYYRQKTVTSVKEAVLTLGVKNLKKWVLIVLIQSLPTDKPSEIINMSVQRGKFLEELCKIKSKNSNEANSYFLVGILSLIDVLTDTDKTKILNELKIDQNIKYAVTNYEGKMGSCLKLVQSIELNEQENIEKICNELDYDIEKVYDIYLESLDVTDMFI